MEKKIDPPPQLNTQCSCTQHECIRFLLRCSSAPIYFITSVFTKVLRITINQSTNTYKISKS